jgi:outer membrane protein assembly factor BamA
VRRSLCTTALLLTSLLCAAQTRWVVAHADSTLPKKWRGTVKVTGPLGAPQWVSAVRTDLIAHGWLEASVDSLAQLGDTTHYFLHLGRAYRWARLGVGNVPREITSAAHFRERFYAQRPLDPRQLARLYETLLDECENNGFPFATVELDSLRPSGDGLNAALHLDKGPLTRIDSIVIKGDARISKRYLYSHIGVAPGDLYNEVLVAGVAKRLRELPFVSQKQQPYVLFTREQTKVYIFLDTRKASSFNGILGIQPDPSSGKVRLTGDLDLRLRNALKRGEAIELNWRSLQDRTQDLKVRFNYPFAFNTPFGTDLSLKLFKRDTTFLEVNARAALEYLLARGDKVSVFVNDKSSQRLGQSFSATAGLGDVKITAYGMGLQRERFDYRFNPREGFGADVDGSVGRKRSTTSSLSDTEAPTFINTTQYEANARLVWHLPVGRRGTVRLVGQGGSMVNEQLFRNELYRMGGLKTLRGVDEASIPCSSFAIGTVEYRFLFEENSNFFLFFDQAWWEDQSQEQLLTDSPLGFGAGTSFETKAGIFSLTYALGQQFDNPVELRGGKVHFGFTSLF